MPTRPRWRGSAKERARRASLDRPLALHGDAPQLAQMGGREIAARVQRAAVVPDDEVADLPAVLVLEFRPLLVLEHAQQQRVAFLARQADDRLGHQAIDVERLAPGRRVRTD